MPDFIEAVNYGRGFNVPCNQEVIHSLECNIIPGIARQLAEGWFQNPSNESSAHTLVDPLEAIDTVPESNQAYHCGTGNRQSYGEEHAGRASFTREQWLTADGTKMLKISAARIAERRHRLGWSRSDFRWLSIGQIQANERGLCTHNDMRIALGGTTHWDPGPNFPYGEFLQWVLEAFDRLSGKTNPVPEDDMTLDEFKTWAKSPDGQKWLMGNVLDPRINTFRRDQFPKDIDKRLDQQGLLPEK